MANTVPPEPSPPDSPSRLFVVGLGASAGGIKALKEFFASVPPATGVAYAVILHLSPDHDSRLAEVLQTTAPMPVSQVTTSTPISPDHVYVVPPNKSLSIADGIFTVAEFTRLEQRRAPVDVFFRALADTHGSRSICAVLSGTGPNGSAGLKRIKEYGGLVLAQDPTEAEYPDMPRNAIATGLVDVVLPVAEMPTQIAAYLERARRDEENAPAAVAPGEDSDALRNVLTMLRVRTGHDFSNYKTTMLQRRVERRMNLRGLGTVTSYAKLIRQEPDEAVSLMKELLISVTNFFRDPAAWMTLEQRVIPRLFERKSPQDQLRVWVPGCATGEEAYSIAMLLCEHASELAEVPSIQVFGTDLDQHAIATARDGMYSEAEVADVSEERLHRFFQREATGYRVRRELRELVLFAHHNVIKDPPFSHLDLICCRNLLIYLNRAVQERITETFHFALRPGGYLFLGGSESPDGNNDLFLRFDHNAHIYESRTPTSRLALALTEVPVSTLRPVARAAEARQDRVFPADLHQRLLERYAPPSVVITEEHHVVHMSERVGRFMQVRGGEPTRDLLLLVRPELRPDLRTALHQATKQRTEIALTGIAVRFEDGVRRVDISVKPILRENDPARGFILVTFDERVEGSADDGAAGVTLTSPAEPLHRQLEEELARVKAQLQATIEQYETQAEEGKASNEELQAMNEELRSAAEELETSKEELQSVNEELTTVNQELQIKIEELGLTNNDFQNFINATDIGTIFLDRALRVKFSTPRAREVFNLLDSDIGRPLSDITSKLRHDAIYKDVRTVLDRLSNVEQEVQTEDGRWHLMRMLPYRTSDNHIDGVVITFQDITERWHAELRVRLSEERLRLLIDSALDYAIFTMTEEGIIDSWNPGAQRMFGYTADEIVGRNFEVLFTQQDREAGVQARELNEARRSGRAADERYHVRKDGSRFYCSGVTRRLGEGGIGFAKIARDLTSQLQAAEALQVANSELDGRVRQRTSQLESAVAEHDAATRAVTGLLHRLVSAQEDERRRIARDLHDHFGQQLTSLRLALERTQRAIETGSSNTDEITNAFALTKEIGRDLDFLAWELRPMALDELGLAAALPRFVKEWSALVGTPTEFRSGNFEAGHLSPDAEVAFFRVAQEALNNVAKHAHATRADVVLSSSDGQVVLVVEDDGVGFDPTDVATLAHGVGLASMRERATLVGAALQIESAPGRGTSVFLRSASRTGSSGDGEGGKPGA
jgi:two-component system, chemotaxis family, CheB/CheR fusion protein